MNSQGVNNQGTDSQNLGSTQRYNSQDIDSQNEDYIRKQILSGQPVSQEPMEYAVPHRRCSRKRRITGRIQQSQNMMCHTRKLYQKSVAPAKPKIEVAEGEIACPQCGNICPEARSSAWSAAAGSLLNKKGNCHSGLQCSII